VTVSRQFAGREIPVFAFYRRVSSVLIQADRRRPQGRQAPIGPREVLGGSGHVRLQRECGAVAELPYGLFQLESGPAAFDPEVKIVARSMNILQFTHIARPMVALEGIPSFSAGILLIRLSIPTSILIRK